MGKRFHRNKGIHQFPVYNAKTRKLEYKDAAAIESPASMDDNYMNSDGDEDEDEGMEQVDESEDDSDEEPQREPSVYDNLIKTLENRRDSRANAYQKREIRNNIASDSEKASNGDDALEGDDEDDDEITELSENNKGRSSGMANALGSSDDEITELSENDGDDDEDDDNVSDAENGSREDNGKGLASSSQCQSNFLVHHAHKLSAKDIEKLLKRKWKYSWNTTSYLSNCIWMGTGDRLSEDADAAAPYGLKLRLYKHWKHVYSSSGGHKFQTSKQRLFFSLCNSYRDILHHHKKPFYHKGSDEDSSIRDAYIMHSLNHIFRSRDLIIKNDAKLSKQRETSREELIPSESFLDQGFTRPKVLVLLPLASIALRYVKRLIHLTPSANKVKVDYMERFDKEFGVDVDDDEDDVKDKLKKPSKPADYQALFGGNNNDHFMVGIKFTRKSIRLYSDFYTSDMIVASPLGLITKIGEAEKNKDKDVDYLSSIEILIVDHADVISMQNWSHVNTVVEHLNLLPSKQHGGDIMRIRPCYLDAHARFYRQTIILSAYLNPDINGFFNRHCLNFQGKLRLSCEYKGVLPKVILQVRQVYERINCDSIVEADDARLLYFKKKVFPTIKDSIQGGTMLFISSYFEFVHIRNFLKEQNASFCLLGEYTKQSDISRARNWFIQGQRKIMLYTERAHFYNRYKIRGIQNLIIYSLPERKEFYPEVLNMLEGSHNMTCTVLFTRFDQLQLERIVGSTAAKRMTSSEKSLFIFK